MKLLTLTLTNFMGIRDFTLDTQGEDIAVYADNGVGKTTLFSAFTWLLRDKDSQNRKDFEIKTIGPDGRALPGLDHSVEGVFELPGGQKITLKKVYKEVWTKKRGAAKATFTGHTTDHYIDGVPVQKKDYQEQIKTMVPDEEVFMLLTNPRYFNDQLHWEKRRQILLEVCGDVTDEEVITNNPELAKLPGILQNRSIDAHRKVVTSRQREVNSSLKQIPVRIDEVTRSLPVLENVNKDLHEKNIESLQELIESEERDLQDLKNGGGDAKLRSQAAELKAAMAELKNKLIDDYEIEQEPIRTQRRKQEAKLIELKEQIETGSKKIDDYLAWIKKLEERIEHARQQWHEENDRTLEYEPDNTCPTCGQTLPAEQVEAARQKAQENFNLEKARILESISDAGKRYKAEADEVWQKLTTEKANLEINQAALTELEHELKTTPEEAPPVNPADNPKYKKLADQLAEVEENITSLKADKSEVIEEKTAALAVKRAALQKSQGELAKFDQHSQGLKRIEELKAQEKELAAEYEELEAEQYLLDQFTRAKVHLLDERINQCFQLARFKMFSENINGGLEPTCETLYDNVPWGAGLNNGAQLNVGIDIINTLADHYKFYPPIMVDNAESVTKLIPSKGQLIKLLVSAQDKKLRVEAIKNKRRLLINDRQDSTE